MTEKNFFAYRLFLSLKLPPVKKVTPIFTSNPRLKVEVLSCLPFWKFGWRLNPAPLPTEREGCTLWQTLMHYAGNHCRELTFAHSKQPDSNRELLVSERKSLTTKTLLNICDKLFSWKYLTAFIQVLKGSRFSLQRNVKC